MLNSYLNYYTCNFTVHVLYVVPNMDELVIKRNSYKKVESRQEEEHFGSSDL